MAFSGFNFRPLQWAFQLLTRRGGGYAKRWLKLRRIKKRRARYERVRPIPLRALETLEGRAFFSTVNGATYDVSVIDKALPQSKLLIRGAAEHTRVITFDSRSESTSDVLQRVIDLGEQTPGARVRALSIFSHGTRGRFALGGEWVSDDTIDNTAGRWRKLRGVLAVDAAVQLFSCDTADGPDGQTLLGKLSNLTGATVFGSTNITGAGGDWDLEAVSRAGVTTFAPSNTAAFPTARLPIDASVLAGYHGTLVWTGATTGSTNDAAHDYNNTANWAGGTIDDSFSGVTLTGGTTLYMSANRTTGAAGLDLNYSGGFDLAIQSSNTTTRTLTLGAGGISGDFGGSGANRTVTIGNATNAVDVSMNAGSRTFNVIGSNDTLAMKNVLSSGTLTKSGAGILTMSGANTYAGGTTISAGTLNVGDHTNPGSNPYINTALGTGAVSVSNATLNLDTQSNGGVVYVVTVANNITLNGSATLKGTEGENHLSGTLTISGTGNLIQPRVSNKPIVIDGALTGTGSVGITGINNGFSPGALIVNSANNTGFTGTLTVNGTTNVGVQLVVGHNTALVNATVVANGPIPSTVSAGSVYTQTTSPIIFASGITAPQFGMLGGTGDIPLLTNSASVAVALTVGGNNDTQTYSGILSGTGSTLTKTGTGALALSGASTFTGGTSLSAGELDINNATAVGSGRLTIAAGTTIDNTSGSAITLSGNNLQTWNGSFSYGGTNDLNLGTGAITIGGNRTITTNGSAVLTVGSVISGAITLTKAGAGTLSLTGTNTYSSGTALSAGALAFSTGSLGSGNITFGASSTLMWNSGNTSDVSNKIQAIGAGVVATFDTNGNAVTLASVLSGSGAVTKEGAGTLTLTAANTYTGGTNIDQGTLAFNNGSLSTGNITFTASSTLLWNSTNTQDVSNKIQAIGSGVVATLDTVANNVTFASILSGAGSIVKSGTGALTLSAANTYSGGTTLNAGTLNINTTSAIGTGTFTINGGTIDNSSGGSFTNANNNALVVNANFTYTGTRSLDMGTGAVTLGVSPTITVGSARLALGGVISGAFGITKAGAGSLALSGANTFTGGLTVSAGKFEFNSASAVGTGTFTINAGTTIDSAAATAITNSNNNAQVWNGSFTFIGTHTLNLGTGNVSLGASPTLAVNGAQLIVGGVISGAQGITKSGGATLALSGANTYSGGTTLSAGTLNINNATAIGTGTFTISGGTIDNTSGGAITLSNNNAQSWGGDYTFTGTNALNLGTGAVALTANRQVTTTASTLTVGGVMSGAFGLTKAGAGTLTLSGTNTFSGGTTLSAGQLNINSAAAIGTGTFTINGGVIDNTSGGSIALSNNNVQNWGGDFTFTGTNDLDLGTGAVTMPASRTVTVTAGNLTVGGNIAGGANTLTAAGNARLILSGTNTLGAISINSAGGRAILRAVSSGAAGSGVVTINGGTNYCTLELAGGITLSNAITFAARSSGQIGIESVSGNNTLSGTVTFQAGGSWFPVQVDAGSNLAFTAATSITSAAGGTRRISLLGPGTGTISGIIQDGSGVIDVTVGNTSTWTLSGANTFTGGVTVSTGAALNINNASALGTGTVTINAGTIDNTSGGAITLSTNNVQSWNGNFIFTGTNALNLGTGAVTLGANRQVTTTASTLTVGGVISGAFSLTKAGAGTLTLSGANTFSGGMTLTTGTLNINNATAVGTGTFAINGGTMDNTSGASITLSNNNVQTWGGDFTFTGSNALDMGTGAVNLSANRIVTTTAGTLTVPGVIGGAFSLTKAGAGTLRLGGVSTYSGGTTVSAGTLEGYNAAGGTSAITPSVFGSTSSTVTVNAGATLWLDYLLGTTGNAVTYANAFSGAGTLKVTAPGSNGAGASSANLSGNLSGITGTIDLFPNSGSLGKTAFTNATPGTQPSASATIKVESGTAVFFSTGLTYASSIQLYGTGNAENLGALRVDSSSVISGTVTLMANASVGTYSGTGTISGVISDGGNGYSITKRANAATVLSGANTYSGGTSVAAGTLRINNTTGSGAGTGAVIVASGTTLGGTGSVSGAITVQSGGTFAPGAPGATAFASGAMTVASGATYSVDVNSSTAGTGYDKITVTGAVTLTGSTLSLAGTRTSNAADVITLIDNDGSDAVVGTFNGLAEGAAVTVNSVPYTLSYAGGTGNDVVLTDAAPTVGIAAAATPNPVTGTTTDLSVLGVSSAGESTLTYTWAATTKPAGSSPTFSANGTNAAKASTVTFDKYGSYVFTVTISNGTDSSTSQVGVTVNQTLTSIVVSPASASLNQNQTQQFSAVAYDQFGAAMASQPSFTWAKQSGVGLVSAGGLYTAPGSGSGSAVVSATSGGVTGTANVTVTNAAPTVATAAAATPSTATGTTTALSVLGADDGGESNLTYTWTATAKPAGSAPAYSANGTNAAKASTVTFDQYGNYTFQVTISDGTNTVTSSVNVTVNQTLTTITVSPSSTSLNLNGTQQFSAVAYDQFGAAMASQPSFTWTKTSGVGSINASGLYTAASTAGSATIQASSGGVNGTASVTVTNAAPTVATPTAAVPSPVTGTTTALSVLGADDNGESNLTYSWSATTKPAGSSPAFSANATNAAKASTVTFDKAGSYTFTVTISDGTSSVTSSVSVTVNQTLTSITVSPSSTSLNLNGTQQFGAVGYDQFGVAMASQPSFTWTKASGVGGVSAGGLYTAASTAGSATVQASSGGVNGTATVTVTNGAPTVSTPAAATPSPVTGTTTALSVLGADDDGESNLTYTWAATSKPAGSNPLFSANGTNAAKASTVTFDKAGSYTFTVTISDGTLTTTSAVTLTVNQTLTSITVAPASTSLNLNGTQQFAATAYDQFGIAMSGQPSFTWTKTSGVGSVNGTGLYTAGATAGSATIQAASGAVNGTATVTVSNAAPTIATPAAASPSPVTGTTTALSALGADDNGESNLTYTWSATTKPAGSNPLFSANGSNAAKASTVTFDKAGSYTFLVTVSDGTSTVTSSVSVTVNQTLTSIAVSPATASLDLNGTQQFSALASDQFGIAMASQPTFTWTKTSGVGSVDSTGLYTAGATAGSATVQAASGGVSGTATVAVSDAAPTVVMPAAATPSPVTGTTTALSVLGTDDGGESNLTYTWAATTKPAGSAPVFSANGSNAAKASTVTFDKAGSYTFTVTISDGTSTVTSSVNVTVSQTLTSIVVSPASASMNLNGTQPFTASGYDQFGLAMASQPGFIWSKTSGVGSVNASGLYAAGATAGSATVQAASGGVTGTASVTVTNAAPTVATPAAASPSPVTGTTTVLSVLGADDNGESNLTYTWSVTALPSGASPSSTTAGTNGTNAGKTGTVTFDKAGSYTFMVMISDGTSSVTSSVTVVVNQTLTSIAVSPASASLNLNGTQQFSAVGYDQFGIAMSSQPGFTWTKASGVGSVDAAGLYTAGATAGSATVQAASGGVTGTANVTVSNAAPTVATPASVTPSPVIGATTALGVLGADDDGESNLTYTWAATSKPAGSAPVFSANGTNAAKASTVTFDKAGSYTFTVTISDGSLTTTSAVTVTVNQTLATIVVSPASTSLNLNGTQQFSAVGYDQFGIAMSSQPGFTWTKTSGVGSIDAAGLYTAGATAGSATVQAASGAVTGSATIVVGNAAPTVATPASATPSPVTGTTTALSVLGADDGGEANLTYTWAATTKPAGSAPVFSANGTNGAKASTVTFDKAGSYSFTVTISDGTSTVTSVVNVTVNQTTTTVTVSPATASLNLNSTQQFSAVVYDQFGLAMASQPGFTWSKTSGVGIINASGLFSSGATAGSSVIAATGNGVSGSASITVADAAPTVATAASATPNTVSGTTTSLGVLGADDGGESNLTYTWSATTKPAGSTPVFSANGTNGSKASTVTFDKSGSYTITVTISDGTSTVTSNVNVTVDQTLASIVVNPSTATAVLNQSQQFSAAGFDQFGNAMAVAPTFTWAVTIGVGTVDNAGNYVSTIAGTATVRASSGGLNGTAAVTIADAAPTVATPAAASPSTVTGTATGLSVLGADDGGEANLVYTWATTAKPGGATDPTFSVNGTHAAQNATATFDAIGNYTFTVTISDGTSSVTSAVNVTVSATLTTIVITPAGTSVELGDTQSFGAVAYDQFGAAMASQPAFTWSVSSGGGGIDAAGLFTAPASVGSSTVTATSGGVSGSTNITVMNSAGIGATPNPITGTTTNLFVGGVVNASLTYTWSTTAKPAGASNPVFSDNATNTAKSMTATFGKAGSYTFEVVISDGSTSTTATETFTVQQTLTTIAVTPASTSVSLNQTHQFTATGYDQFGNAMASQPSFTWSVTSGVGSVSAGGLYTAAGTVGTATVRAASGGLNGTATVNVANSGPTIATPAAATPSPVTATSTALNVLGADDGGEAALTYTWAVTTAPGGATPIFSDNGNNAAKDTVVTFDKAGSYTFTVTISDAYGVTTTDAVTVTVQQTLSSITVSPSSSSLNLNGTQQFSAVGYDQFGVAMASQPSFTWSKASGVGSVNGTGLYTAAATVGSATVQAATGGVSGTASVTVTDAAPTVATPATASPSPATGTTASLSVLGADDGGENNLTYIWAATSKPTSSTPTFISNGTNAAKAGTVTFDQAGSYTFTVTISDGTSTVTSNVNVTVNQTLTSVTVNPATASLNLNQTQAFTAVGFDQFGDALATQPAFVWSVSSGPGTIDSAGTYSSGATPGSATVAATSGGVTGTAAVAVADAAPTVATPASAAPMTVTGTTTTLGVLGADDGGENNLTYTWTATAQPAGSNPLFGSNGSNGAKSSVLTFDTAGAYTFLVTISDGTSTVTSSVNVTVAQTLSSIAVSPASTSLDLHQSESFSAVGYDQFGDVLAGQPAFTWSVQSGVGTIDASGLYQSDSAAGGAVIRATSGGVIGTATVSVANAAPTVAIAASATPGTVTGTTTDLSVLGADDGGESLLTYTWVATVKPAGSTAIFSANGSNTAKDTVVTFDQAGNYTFTVTINDGTSSVTSTVNVTVSQTLTSIVVSPASTSLNLNGTQQFTAVGFDQFADPMASQPPFAWSVASGVGSVDAAGLYDAGPIAGSATVAATSGGVSGTATVSTTAAAPTVATPASATPGTVNSTSVNLGVLGADDGGEANLVYSWSVITGPAGSHPIFDIDGTNAAKNVVVTFDMAGSYSFLVTISDGTSTVTSSVSATVTQTVTSLSVTPPSASLNLNGTQQFGATAYDQFGAAMAVQPTVTWSESGGHGTVDSSGLFTAGTTPGSDIVQAAVGGVSASVTVTIGNAAPTVVTPASASPSAVTGNSVSLGVLGDDDGGEANLTYTWSVTGQPAGANPLFSSNGSHTAKNSVATFDAAGSYTFLVTISDGSLTTTSSVSVTVAQTLTTIAVTPSTSTLNLNGDETFSAVAFDQFGDTMTTQPAFAWAVSAGVGSITSGGIYSAGSTPGSATVEASFGGVIGTATVSVINSAPVIAVPASAGPASVAGTTSALGVLGADDAGESLLTYTWTLTGQPLGSSPLFSNNGTNSAKNTLVTFDAAGSYTFQVTVSDGTLSAVSSVNVTVTQTLTRIDVSPPSASMHVTGSQQLTAAGFDQFGAAMVTPPAFTWAIDAGGVGAIDGNGLYTAGTTAGAATVRASANGVDGVASVSVADSSPTVASVATASPGSVAGTTTALAVLGADDGGESGLTYTWTVTSRPLFSNPLFSANGTHGARNTAVTFDATGNYSFLVTITDGAGQQVTSAVNVVVAQTLTSIALTPPAASFSPNQSTQFAAVAYDQFGEELATQPAFAWTVASGIGWIDGAGNYSTGSSAGVAIVQAASGGITGTAAVSVTDTAPAVVMPASAMLNPTGLTATLAVAGTDDGGDANLTYTWTTTAAPAGANPASEVSNGTNAAQSLQVTFSEAGTYSFLVMISDGTFSATSAVTLTVGQIVTAVTVTPTARQVGLNLTQQFQANVSDQFGNAITSPAGLVWSIVSGPGGINAAGLYTAGATAGPVTVMASINGVTDTAGLTVVNAAPGVGAAAAATLNAGQTSATLGVVGTDADGESTLTYTWDVIDRPAGARPAFVDNGTHAAQLTQVMLNRAGTYVFAVTISDGTSSTVSTVTLIVAPTIADIQVGPDTADIVGGGAVQFTATAIDQFGQVMPAAPAFNWSLDAGSVGTLAADGTYTVGEDESGFGLVRVTAGGRVSGTALVVVTAGAIEMPKDILGRSDRPGMLHLEWVSAINPVGGYQIEVSLDGETWTTLTLLAPTARSYDVEGMAAGSRLFRIVALGRNNRATDSEPVTVTIQPAAPVPPVVPTEPVVPPPPVPPVLPVSPLPPIAPIPAVPAFIPTTPSQPAITPVNPPTDYSGSTDPMKPAGPVTPAQPGEGAPAGENGESTSPNGPPAADPPPGTPAPEASNANAAPPAAMNSAELARSAVVTLEQARATVAAYRAAAASPAAQAAAEKAESEAIEEHARQATIATTATVTAATALTGYLLWLIQSGSLTVSMLCAMPYWKLFDPLPVLSSWDDKWRKRGDLDDDEEQNPNSEEHELDDILESD